MHKQSNVGRKYNQIGMQYIQNASNIGNLIGFLCSIVIYILPSEIRSNWNEKVETAFGEICLMLKEMLYSIYVVSNFIEIKSVVKAFSANLIQSFYASLNFSPMQMEW